LRGLKIHVFSIWQTLTVTNKMKLRKMLEAVKNGVERGQSKVNPRSGSKTEVINRRKCSLIVQTKIVELSTSSAGRMEHRKWNCRSHTLRNECLTACPYWEIINPMSVEQWRLTHFHPCRRWFWRINSKRVQRRICRSNSAANSPTRVADTQFDTHSIHIAVSPAVNRHVDRYMYWYKSV